MWARGLQLARTNSWRFDLFYGATTSKRHGGARWFVSPTLSVVPSRILYKMSRWLSATYSVSIRLCNSWSPVEFCIHVDEREAPDHTWHLLLLVHATWTFLAMIMWTYQSPEHRRQNWPRWCASLIETRGTSAVQLFLQDWRSGRQIHTMSLLISGADGLLTNCST